MNKKCTETVKWPVRDVENRSRFWMINIIIIDEDKTENSIFEQQLHAIDAIFLPSHHNSFIFICVFLDVTENPTYLFSSAHFRCYRLSWMLLSAFLSLFHRMAFHIWRILTASSSSNIFISPQTQQHMIIYWKWIETIFVSWYIRLFNAIFYSHLNCI